MDTIVWILMCAVIVCAYLYVYRRHAPATEGFSDAVAQNAAALHATAAPPAQNSSRRQFPAPSNAARSAYAPFHAANSAPATNAVPTENRVQRSGNTNAAPMANNTVAAVMARDDADQLCEEDLLPADENTLWSSVMPKGAGSLEEKNFLQAGYHLGINTVGQSLRNANYQLRSDPPNPRMTVSPWMQSTIDPDLNRRNFEIS